MPVTETPANDDIATAFGPLSGDVAYTGQFESLGDVDWLYLHAQSAVPLVRAQVTKVGAGCTPRIRASLLDAQGEFLRAT